MIEVLFYVLVCLLMIFQILMIIWLLADMLIDVLDNR